MSYYSILEVTPTSEDWIQEYLPAANKLVKQYGGRYLARTANHIQVEGEKNEAGLHIVLEWPSKSAAMDFMNDPAYAPHLKARTEGSISNHFLIEGKDDLA